MWKYALWVFLGACSFGLLSTVVKLAYGRGFIPGEIISIQVSFGAALLWILFFIGRSTGTLRKYVPEKPVAYLHLLLCGLSTGTVSILYYLCVEQVPASIAIVLLMQFVWMGTLFDYIIFRTSPSPIQLGCSVLVLLGTLFAAGIFEQGLSTLPLKGLLYGLGAAAAYAVFLMVNGRVGNAFPAVHKSALMLSGAFLLVLLFYPPAYLWNGRLVAGLWMYGLFLATFGTVLPPLLYALGIPRIGVAASAIISSAELPVAVGMSYLVLHESVSLLQWIGVVVILLGIILPNLRSRKTR